MKYVQNQVCWIVYTKLLREVASHHGVVHIVRTTLPGLDGTRLCFRQELERELLGCRHASRYPYRLR